MAENTHTHWTEDNDLLSEYVLGRLPAERVKRLEVHLQTCSVCQEAVRHEQVLASGVRRHARGELKARLGTMLRDRAARRDQWATWQRALAVAALVVIVFGVGLLEGWFGVGRRGVFPSLSEGPHGEPSAVTPLDSSKALKEQAPQAQTMGEKTPSRTETHAAERAPAQRVSDEAATPRQLLEPKSDRNAQPAGAPANLAIEQEKKKVTEKDLGRIADEGLSKPYAPALWVAGEELTSVPALRDKSRPDEKLLMRAEQAMQQQGAGATRDMPQKIDLASGKRFEFRQATTEMLPRSRHRFEESQPLQIQTLFRRTNHGTDVTIYLDTLLNDTELQSGQVTRVARDSIVVVFKSMRLGYKLPADFLDSVMGVK